TCTVAMRESSRTVCRIGRPRLGSPAIGNCDVTIRMRTERRTGPEVAWRMGAVRATPTGGARPKTARLGELDALRGLAALAVVAFHYTTSYAQQVGHLQPLGFGFTPGNYGVHLFFLISGYVIFMTLEHTRDGMDFVVSRFSRLYPAYWFCIAV